MSVRAAEVEIERPCPVELPESFRGGAPTRHCGHCDKTVHLLSSLTEAQARAFLDEHAGEDVCVTYLVDADGRVQFRPEPTVVPISALRRRAPVAALGLGLALAACAPHDNPRVAKTVEQRELEPPPPTDVMTEHPLVAGGIGPVREPPPPPPPPELLVAGGMRPLEVPPPPRPQLRRGGRVRRPVDQ